MGRIGVMVYGSVIVLQPNRGYKRGGILWSIIKGLIEIKDSYTSIC